MFKDLIFPQWWLDWIIPLTSLAMLLQALEMIIDAQPQHRPVSHEAVRARARHPAGGNAVSWGAILTLMFASKVGLLLIALPVAFVFFIINIAGSYLIFGGLPGLEQMVRNEQLSVAQFSLVPIPLFVLMGEVLFHTGLAMKSVDAVDAVIRRVPGTPCGRHAGRWHDFLGHLRVDHRDHRDAGLAAAAADATAEL